MNHTPIAATFNCPPILLSGGGSSNELGNLAKRLRGSRILLITDKFLVNKGIASRFVDLLRSADVDAEIFSDIQPDPTDANVRAGVEACRNLNADAIVSLGGGSPIDAGKVVAVSAAHEGPIRQFQGYHQVPKKGLPFIAIPTTAGTGSEVTKVAVITDTERNIKMMMLDEYLMPDAAIVDYELSMSMPPALTANVGVDTLTHGIEAFVSHKANLMTDPLALSCIRLSASNLESAYHKPNSREAREAMAMAACHGGLAFANSSVCLVHGMSRPIGAVYHLPHGLSNAVLLPEVTRFSIHGARARYAQISRTMGLSTEYHSDEEASELLIKGLESQNNTLKIPKLGECLNITKKEFLKGLDKMATDALDSGSPANNPVVPTKAEIIEIYKRAF